MSHPVIRSVNVGSLTDLPGPRGRTIRTGIVKEPVDSVRVAPVVGRKGGLSGVDGDHIGSRKHHGGQFQAVYAFAREELDRWAEELDRDLPDGWFGENLTTEGYDVDAALVGERWRIGDEVVLEVTSSRTPCATFAARMGEPRWVKRFADRGRTGAYFMVIEPGTIRRGDAITVISRPDHDITVSVLFAARSGDLAAAKRVLAADCMVDPVHRDQLERSVAGSGTRPA